MKCDSPFFVNNSSVNLAKGMPERVPVPCGKCASCKLRRVNSWVFRLLQEEKISASAHFITLTYDTRFVPISDNGFMTLKKVDFQDYMKRLRKLCDLPLKYYAVGEYGSRNRRPHYHAIVFNVKDSEDFFRAWSLDGQNLGSVHVGQVTSDSIAYTLKYIDKPSFCKQHGRDDRSPEFSLMSKGLGSSYVTPEIVRYHRENLDKVYLVKLSGHRVAMPRYYRDKIFSEDEKRLQVKLIQSAIDSEEIEKRRYFDSMPPYGKDFTFDDLVDCQRMARDNKFYHNQKSRDT